MNLDDMRSFKVLVTGGRHYQDADRVWEVLDRIHAEHPIDLLIHGDCKTGADQHADKWALMRGVQPVRCPALWTHFDLAAGPKRNRLMLHLWPHLVVAFPGNKGTADMVKAAAAVDVYVETITPR